MENIFSTHSKFIKPDHVYIFPETVVCFIIYQIPLDHMEAHTLDPD